MTSASRRPKRPIVCATSSGRRSNSARSACSTSTLPARARRSSAASACSFGGECAVVQRHVVAGGVQAARDRRADAAGAAGDQGDGAGVGHGRGFGHVASRATSCPALCRGRHRMPHRRGNAVHGHRLPAPDADALAHSERLRALIQEQIRAAGGAIPFSRFMELCLYAPGLGYYSAGATKFGAAGDFVTAPELGPAVRRLRRRRRRAGAAAARARTRTSSNSAAAAARSPKSRSRSCWRWMRCPRATRSSNPAPTCASASASACAQQLNPLLFDLVEWLDAPPQQPWDGVLFANEVIDALPTPRFTPARRRSVRGTRRARWRRPLHAHRSARRCVARRRRAPCRTPARRAVPRRLPLRTAAATAVLGAGGDRRPARGAMLFVDYGYPRARVLPAATQRRHAARVPPPPLVDDVYACPGLQDITASVDFTALAEAGTGAGFDFAATARRRVS